MTRFLLPGLLAGVALLSACGDDAVPEPKRTARAAEVEPEPQTGDIPQTVTAIAKGTTPMAERTAVVGLLNKRNGISRDLTLKPGQAIRTGDVVVRLRACETTAPHEIQQLTGAFLQLDVANPQGRFQRVFSGWLYREAPALNVVQHPVYDVWPKSCAMTHPAAAGSEERGPSDRSSAPNAAGGPEPDSASASNDT